ncbi:uncharacterized protein I206_107790 [Kwoniella pini CBS 10737]|uniref:Something about silencing protein 4 domain-containing protein n=1 Tax=Kwoniella pini CBS 10737 TaxID=1296096 RepID=A0A1B9HYA2_9TREE|nr:uncharacterized protein I206_06123 [Kwoniella pini CBS 10737]OCF48255.1 hypothetical protein I206_06123 [Kwoniella pini CBS 10737]
MSSIRRIQPRRSSTSYTDDNSNTHINAIASSSNTKKTRNTSSNLASNEIVTESISDDETNQAGPSRPKYPGSEISDVGDTQSIDVKGKGKARNLVKQPERRVLPARIRRSAGGGEGMREVEEMIMDWLERWGEPSTTPPDNLPIYLTSIPLSYVDPPTFKAIIRPEMTITHTPTRKKSIIDIGIQGEKEKIEVPDWVMIKPGEDDQEEAREELNFGPKGVTSPIKRLRRGGIGLADELEEDTSDSYYINLHRKYEVFEKRQKIREKEKLQFERYKMKSRLELLKNIPKLNWTVIVSTILQRVSPTNSSSGNEDVWLKGKNKINEKGEDWLKRQLIKEGEEVMKRFDELLPPEQRKPKTSTSTSTSTLGRSNSRLSTPSRASPSPSLTPPPHIVPARVAALRDPSTLSNGKRRRRSMGAEKHSASEVAETPSKMTKGTRKSTRVVRTYGDNMGNPGGVDNKDVIIVDDDQEEEQERLENDSDPEELESSQEIIKPTSSKSRRSMPATNHTHELPAAIPDPVKKPTSIPPVPIKNKIINHTQQSIKAFFTRPSTISTVIPPSSNLVKPIAIAPKTPIASKTSIAPKTPIAVDQPTSNTSTVKPNPTTNHTKSTTIIKDITTNPVVKREISSTSEVHTRHAMIIPRPMTTSRVPCLIEAASKRESLHHFDNVHLSSSSDSQTDMIDKKVISNRRQPQPIARSNDKNVGADIEIREVKPFGVALPGRLEWQSEFTISDEEDFWPIIANRKHSKTKSKSFNDHEISNGNATPQQPPRLPPSIVKPVQIQQDNTFILSPEEFEELEGVEQAVVL